MIIQFLELTFTLEPTDLFANFTRNQYQGSSELKMRGIPKMLNFLFLTQTIWCDHSLESSQIDDSNEWSHHRFG